MMLSFVFDGMLHPSGQNRQKSSLKASGQNRQKSSLKECVFIKYSAIFSKIHSYRRAFSAILPTGIADQCHSLFSQGIRLLPFLSIVNFGDNDLNIFIIASNNCCL